MRSNSPKAHQLKVGSVHNQSWYDQSADYPSEDSSEDSFCLQMKVQPPCDETVTKCTAPQHLVTNLEMKLKPQKNKTKFLRARIDTCANVSVIPISVYKLLYKDPDCVKLAPSSKNGISTYTTEKIPVLESCDLFVVHPDTGSLKKVTFQVVNQEGSVIVSCTTSLDLGLIQLHSELYTSLPECGRLIFSSADHPNKYQNKKVESNSSVAKVPETEANQSITQEVQDKNKQQQCPAQNDTLIQTRKYHKVKRENMRPQKSNNCAVRHRTEHKEVQNVMLPHKPEIKLKKPGQETYKEVLQNKNCSNINIVNMRP